jgi:hypothetical protein
MEPLKAPRMPKTPRIEIHAINTTGRARKEKAASRIK